MLDYDYIKNHYRLIAVNLSWQKELDADPKAIQQTEFDGQIKNSDGAIVYVCFNDLRKNQRNETQIFQANVAVL